MNAKRVGERALWPACKSWLVGSMLAGLFFLIVVTGGASAVFAQGNAAGQPRPGDEQALSLAECISVALERSPTLGQAEEGLLAAQGNVGLARSELLPGLTLSSTATSYGREQTYYNQHARDLADVFPAVTRRVYRTGLTLRQPLFHGGGDWSKLGAAKHRRDGAREGLRDARSRTVLRVEEAYLELLRAQHLLTVAEETLEASRHRQDRVEALFAVGSVARADVLQNKVQLGQDELGVIRARNQVELARAALLNAMGMTVDRSISVEEVPLPEESVPEVRELLGQAEARNASLMDLREAAQAGRADLATARASRYPALDLYGDYNWDHYRLTGTDWPDHTAWTISLQLSYPIFDGLATRSGISTARHALRESEKRVEQARLDLALEVKRQHSSLIEARERIRVAGESVASAEERLRLEDERYRLGAATLLELIEAQVGLTRAKTSEVEARYDYLQARARLGQAVGRE